jgi:hypothetical protein
MSKFTAGSWEFVELMESDGEEFAGVILTPTEEEEIACEQLRYDGKDLAHCYGKDAEENARLMAAAPDLYEAVKDLLDAFCEDERWEGTAIYDMAKKALAKAEGKEYV